MRRTTTSSVGVPQIEQIHRPEDDYGKVVTPYRHVMTDAGWLTCPLNQGKYTGENSEWRE